MCSIFLLQQTFSTVTWIFLTGIQVLILAAFVFMLVFFCKKLKAKQPDKNNKKTCIVIWFLSAVAWFLIAQIVWIITSIQMSGS
ncbi:MAG: hypothetical protein CR986_08630 [Ignavibacteriae bacterium]|nr:MAG: hypothetical protein CR986_08630 [Ignavibacteriota bacterium]